MDLRKLENDLYDIEIQDEINTTPMKRYIDGSNREWTTSTRKGYNWSTGLH